MNRIPSNLRRLLEERRVFLQPLERIAFREIDLRVEFRNVFAEEVGVGHVRCDWQPLFAFLLGAPLEADLHWGMV